ncbi:hypothetical protein [Massilia sp. YMA4]|uniref:hypothetical protein n=1 Tax=Massilia sp. YMA4 TaxID=1593482 RepID=UPI001583064A|nr:hypothetical protein [Massilia sp. YMA4]
MLKVIAGSNCGPIEVEFGDYVPFKFSNRVEARSPRLYWRTGNFKSTLLEVEIDRETGVIAGVILLLPGQVSRNFPAQIVPEGKLHSGVPIVDACYWPDDRVRDEPNEISVFIGDNRLLILLSSGSMAKMAYSAGCATFGVDANDSLVWALIDDLPKDKLDAIATM